MTLDRVSFKQGKSKEPRLSAPYVPGQHSKRYWTEEEMAVIRQYYPDGGLAACQAHLPPHRQAPSSIYGMAHKLGLAVNMAKAMARRKRAHPKGYYDEIIRARWPELTGKGAVARLADELGIPRWQLSVRARALGLTMPHKKEPPWTEAETQLMRKAPLHDPDKAAEIFRQHGFNRSPSAIMVRAKRLNLSRRKREGLSSRSAAMILGVDSKFITARCVAGTLKASRGGTKRLSQQGGDYWSITRADFRAYILAHLEEIDIRKVEKFSFVDLLIKEGLSP